MPIQIFLTKFYIMDLIKITDNKLLLSSGLKQDSFAKTNYSELLREKNLLVTFNDGKISTEEYKFTGTRTCENDITDFEGSSENFSNGKLISEILDNLPENRTQFSENDRFSIYAYSKAAGFIANNELCNDFGKHGGGVIIDSDFKTKTARILFINPNLFEICAQNQRKNYAGVQGKFIYKGLNPLSSLCFTRAVIAYKALTGKYPFEESDTTKRQEDIFDHNFTPVDFYSESIDKKLSDSINSSLSLNVSENITAGKKNLTDSKKEKKEKKLIERAELFDSEILNSEMHKEKAESPALLEKKLKYEKNLRKFISAKRFLRRNRNRILASIAAVIVVGWFINGYLEQNGKLVTTKGLTSKETSALLYSMIHKADVPNVQEIVKGKHTKDLLVKLSGYYVSSKQRLETSPQNGTVTPEKWFCYQKDTKNWMFGLSNLFIDGEKTSLYPEYSVKKDKPAPIQNENGKNLNKGDIITHNAEYYFIRQAEAKIFIDKMTDEITLQWNGKQWNVIKISGKAKTESVNAKDFKNEYHTIIDNLKNEDADTPENDDSPYINKEKVLKALGILRKKYEWLPCELEIEK